ncbi:hypothetical protein Agabi119p4_9819 [Agaricus bisporus var. burnettii]|uniref:Uncharacterized protein n=1 Tax=Agaricus bisporus var. burnettii TaxID=192524 RepID=A0A8H7C3Y5_AGABI|nr:hypothetical protein Agabi119p4_9819 [Agaricus bisporus var. burnettii]
MSEVENCPPDTSTTTTTTAASGQGWHFETASPIIDASPSLHIPETAAPPQPLRDLACYATRNPTKPIIKPSHSYQKPVVDKLTKSLKKHLRDESQKSFDDAIRDSIAHRNEEIETLARSHGRTKQYI